MMEFSNEIMDFVRDQLGAARERTKTLKMQWEEATEVERAWNDLLHFVANEWFMHILELLDKQAHIFKKLGTENSDVASTLGHIRPVAETKTDSILRRYPAYLEEASHEANLPLDPDSRHPRYSLEKKFFLLEIDEKKRMARLSNHEGRLAELPADIGAVVGTIQKEHKRIFDRPFEGKKFLKRLRTQYRAILKKEKQQDGASIPIRRITRRLGKNLKGFRTDEFLLDLSRLVEKGPFEIEGRRLDLQQTKDTNQGMLLHGAAGRGYIGFIVFKEV